MPYKNIEQRRKYSKNYYKNHKNYWKTKSYKNKKRIYDIKYRKLKHNKMKKYQKKYTNTRRKIDINFKLATYLRNRIYYALKENSKSKSTLELLGCSIEFLKGYLSYQFKVGMSFDNYGKWEIDHIKPCASFDLTKTKEQKKCFSYKNLQPLWKSENRHKYIN